MLSIIERSGAGKFDKPTELALASARGQASRLPWVWDGLVFAVPMHEASNEGLRDVANTKQYASKQGVSWKWDGQGQPAAQMTTASSGGWVNYANYPVHDSPSAAVTVYVRVKRLGTGDPGTAWLSNFWDSSNMSYGIGHDSNAIPYGHLRLGSVNTRVGDLPAPSTTEFSSIFFRWRSGEAPRLDMLGERGNTVATLTHGSTLSGTISYASGNGIYLNSLDGFYKTDSQFSQAMVWARRLNDVELTLLVADPFGWYSPRRETVVLAGPFPIASLESLLRIVT